MGVLNITPDSFSDGGLFFHETQAYDQASLMIFPSSLTNFMMLPGFKSLLSEDDNKKVEIKKKCSSPVH